MKKQAETKSIQMGIRAKMLLFFGVAVAFSLASLSLLNLFGVPFIGIKGSYQIHRDEVIQKINDLVDLKKENIEHWFKERTNHIKTFAGNTQIDDITVMFKNGMVRGEDKGSFLKRIRNTVEYKKNLQRAQTVLNNNPDYLEIRIADIKTGLVVFSTDEKNIGIDLSDNKEIKNAGDPGVVEQVYFKKEKTSGNKRLNIIYPIMPKHMAGDTETPSFAAMLVIDPERRLIPYFHSGTGLEKSGEIVLIDMNRIILTPLKYLLPGNRKAESLEYVLDTKSAELAAWGIDGVVFAKDYRGVPIIAGVRHMKITSEYGVGLIAEIDEEEVLNFAREGLVNSLFISSFGLLFLLWIIYFVSGRIARPVTQLSHTAQKIMEGNLDERSPIKTTDEVGRLAGSFNSMVEELQKWHKELETKVRERSEDLNLELNERRKAEERISRLSRLYSVLSKINEAIVRTNKPEELYRQACSIIVEEGAFRMAWIGIVDPVTLLVKPVVICGHEDGYLKNNKISVDERIPEGRGPTGTAIRKGGYFVCNDIENDPAMLPWRDEALKRGYRSSAALALKSGDKIIGSLNIYSSVARFFQEEEEEEEEEEEIKLLKSLAEDISFAIESMEIEKQRRKAEHELKRLTEELESRVTERTAELADNQRALMSIVEDLNQKSEELKSANEKIKELDRLKSMFIASMSHELRTPLNSIIGFSSIMLNEWIGPMNLEQKENTGIILRAGRHLLALINDVIDISKIEAEKIEVMTEKFDLYDLVSEAASAHIKDMQNKGLEFRLDSLPQAMNTDRRRLLQCIHNLMSNAIKFTEKGSVSVQTRVVSSEIRTVNSEQYIVNSKELFTNDYSLTADADFVEISVVDTGIGIKEEDIPKLFQPFIRIDSPLKITVPGTGLGLYLTKKLVNQVLKGEVEVKSRFGEGSTFKIIIPVGI